MLKHILFPSDFSPSATVAFEYVLALARPFRARVTLLHVHEYSPLMIASDSALAYPTYFQELESQAEARARTELEKLRAQLLEAGLEGDVRYLTGHAGQHIVKLADGTSDLIVMGSRGLGAVSSFLLGSTSNYVLHHAQCPVLVIPMNQDDKSGNASP